MSGLETSGNILKKLVSKAEIRAHLEQEMNLFERDGGSVEKIPRGISGKGPQDTPPPNTRRLFLEPSEKRTHIPEVVAAIEARRKQKPTSQGSTATKAQRKPRQKTIYDDFGEPLRTVWVDD